MKIKQYKKAHFIGGPLDGEVDDDPMPPEECDGLVVRGNMSDHLYRVVRQFAKRPGKVLRTRIRYIYTGVIDEEEDQFTGQGGQDGA